MASEQRPVKGSGEGRGGGKGERGRDSLTFLLSLLAFGSLLAHQACSLTTNPTLESVKASEVPHWCTVPGSAKTANKFLLLNVSSTHQGYII